MIQTDFLLGVLSLIFAPFLGSFFALLADRIPREEPVGLTRSACRSCATPLTVLDLVPILSFLCLRGRCRHCGAPIPKQTLLFELGALVLAGQAFLAFGGGWPVPLSLMLGLVLLTLSVIDGAHFYLPDKLTLPLVLAGLAVAALGLGTDLLSAAIGAIIGYGLLYSIAFFYRMMRGREGLGLGDAKLLAAAGAWLGWFSLPYVLVIASLCGLFYAFILQRMGRGLSAQDALPFGPFLAFGFWLVWLYGPAIYGLGAAF
ncbi:type 4 prepilin-like proteins leader peptide-processing enzyme [Iodidimonas muriae]|uniref:Prepilin leader peptidase/N-methyltransferase n=1 Tax=Iodidimonas muriae TaxID=261467 RepID=A0ABQ2LF25_9PROT|nr:A24 family peptidase [Iodidimonas muriae]GER07198.1 type 4 prepilin-like proteins leader peptide-processing enzyme [Kordiimonadales bacterium JCM 17843]GGO11551.1 type 4 prepilin-like proteins leader peptide-processing enzyme [Iodidimonas muriae]